MLPLVYSDDLTPYKSINEEGVSIKLNTQNERLKLSMIEGCQSLHIKLPTIHISGNYNLAAYIKKGKFRLIMCV